MEIEENNRGEPLAGKENDVTTQKISRKNKDSKKKKEEKILDQALKTLSAFSSPAEKLEALCKKYIDLIDDNKKQSQALKSTEKRIAHLEKERDHLQTEQTKAALNRSRLELLCRELQRQNKLMKEENQQRIREEEERRKEVSAKFQATLSEITALMKQNTDSNSKLREENMEMQEQFKGVFEQYELREQQVEKISKQMKLEGQLAEAKLAKAQLELQAQKEVLEHDKAQLLAEIAMYKQKCAQHEETETSLKAQINAYHEKYDEFQTVLTRSNQVYSGFKTEIEKMSKKITKLEKETASWKEKWESTHKALLALAAEKQLKDAENALQGKQLSQLQKLCRTLQAERASLVQQLNSTAPSTTTPKEPKDSGNQNITATNKLDEEPSPDKADPSPASKCSAPVEASPKVEKNNDSSKKEEIVSEEVPIIEKDTGDLKEEVDEPSQAQMQRYKIRSGPEVKSLPLKKKRNNANPSPDVGSMVTGSKSEYERRCSGPSYGYSNNFSRQNSIIKRYERIGSVAVSKRNKSIMVSAKASTDDIPSLRSNDSKTKKSMYYCTETNMDSEVSSIPRPRVRRLTKHRCVIEEPSSPVNNKPKDKVTERLAKKKVDECGEGLNERKENTKISQKQKPTTKTGIENEEPETANVAKAKTPRGNYDCDEIFPTKTSLERKPPLGYFFDEGRKEKKKRVEYLSLADVGPNAKIKNSPDNKEEDSTNNPELCLGDIKPIEHSWGRNSAEDPDRTLTREDDAPMEYGIETADIPSKNKEKRKSLHKRRKAAIARSASELNLEGISESSHCERKCLTDRDPKFGYKRKDVRLFSKCLTKYECFKLFSLVCVKEHVANCSGQSRPQGQCSTIDGVDDDEFVSCEEFDCNPKPRKGSRRKEGGRTSEQKEAFNPITGNEEQVSTSSKKGEESPTVCGDTHNQDQHRLKSQGHHVEGDCSIEKEDHIKECEIDEFGDGKLMDSLENELKGSDAMTNDDKFSVDEQKHEGFHSNRSKRGFEIHPSVTDYWQTTPTSLEKPGRVSQALNVLKGEFAKMALKLEEEFIQSYNSCCEMGGKHLSEPTEESNEATPNLVEKEIDNNTHLSLRDDNGVHETKTPSDFSLIGESVLSVLEDHPVENASSPLDPVGDSGKLQDIGTLETEKQENMTLTKFDTPENVKEQCSSSGAPFANPLKNNSKPVDTQETRILHQNELSAGNSNVDGREEILIANLNITTDSYKLKDSTYTAIDEKAKEMGGNESIAPNSAPVCNFNTQPCTLINLDNEKTLDANVEKAQDGNGKGEESSDKRNGDKASDKGDEAEGNVRNEPIFDNQGSPSVEKTNYVDVSTGDDNILPGTVCCVCLQEEIKYRKERSEVVQKIKELSSSLKSLPTMHSENTGSEVRSECCSTSEIGSSSVRVDIPSMFNVAKTFANNCHNKTIEAGENVKKLKGSPPEVKSESCSTSELSSSSIRREILNIPMVEKTVGDDCQSKTVEVVKKIKELSLSLKGSPEVKSESCSTTEISCSSIRGQVPNVLTVKKPLADDYLKLKSMEVVNKLKELSSSLKRSPHVKSECCSTSEISSSLIRDDIPKPIILTKKFSESSEGYSKLNSGDESDTSGVTTSTFNDSTHSELTKTSDFWKENDLSSRKEPLNNSESTKTLFALSEIDREETDDMESPIQKNDCGDTSETTVNKTKTEGDIPVETYCTKDGAVTINCSSKKVSNITMVAEGPRSSTQLNIQFTGKRMIVNAQYVANIGSSEEAPLPPENVLDTSDSVIIIKSPQESVQQLPGVGSSVCMSPSEGIIIMSRISDGLTSKSAGGDVPEEEYELKATKSQTQLADEMSDSTLVLSGLSSSSMSVIGRSVPKRNPKVKPPDVPPIKSGKVSETERGYSQVESCAKAMERNSIAPGNISSGNEPSDWDILVKIIALTSQSLCSSSDMTVSRNSRACDSEGEDNSQLTILNISESESGTVSSEPDTCLRAVESTTIELNARRREMSSVSDRGDAELNVKVGGQLQNPLSPVDDGKEGMNLCIAGNGSSNVVVVSDANGYTTVGQTLSELKEIAEVSKEIHLYRASFQVKTGENTFATIMITDGSDEESPKSYSTQVVMDKGQEGDHRGMGPNVDTNACLHRAVFTVKTGDDNYTTIVVTDSSTRIGDSGPSTRRDTSNLLANKTLLYNDEDLLGLKADCQS